MPGAPSITGSNLSASRRHRSVRSSSLKVKKCTPAMSPDVNRRSSGSGVNERVTKRRSQGRWDRRKRADSPRPIFIETRSSLALSTTPGTPTQIGSSVPRARTRAIQVSMTAGSKQIWLTM